jgi:hypothetical protein
LIAKVASPLVQTLNPTATNLFSGIRGGMPRPPTTPKLPNPVTGIRPSYVAPQNPVSTPPASAPTQPTQPKTPTTPAAPAGGGSDPFAGAYNLDSDPIVQKIKALNAANYAQAVAATQSNAKQDLITSGFDFSQLLKNNPSLAQGVLGSVFGDQATQLAARNNPYSTAANLALSHNQNVDKIDQLNNAANTFYSSARANNQSAEAHNYLGQVDQAQTTLGQALSTLLQNLAQTKEQEDMALMNAYMQAEANAIASGNWPGGGGGSQAPDESVTGGGVTAAAGRRPTVAAPWQRALVNAGWATRY